ncbi:glycerophosphodiester phosphodiesterase family protein [Oceanivirga miroungae]|uniref:Glycerophosphodiester phosphodiesterase n=1 Tax=Oceanivirga miroungae TaxID=1130046 RepID=A0A6I8M508_9FUSO|nr:glycerophosphodiester phosphodiesterase family protein [Oceanivirga miroungae]VWL85006.1 Glycerophosphodiester phosphodiesterase [Oceanivirga miroungae]
MDSMKENIWSKKGKIIWLYTKYLIITKLITATLLLPSFSFITSKLVHLSGRTNLTSGNYKGFILSIYGLPLIVIGVLLLAVILAIDINTFIITSALIEEGKLNIKLKSVLIEAIKSVKHFFSPVGMIMVLFVAFAMPLIGLEIKLGPLEEFKIPNFITSVIFGNTLYLSIYIISLLLLFIIAITYSLTIHFILIDGQDIKKALKSSRLFMKKYWKTFIKDYIIKIIKLTIKSGIAILVFVLIAYIFDIVFSRFYTNDNVSFIMLLLALSEIIGYIAFLAVPLAISHLTELFYEYHKKEGKILKLKLVPEEELIVNEKCSKNISMKTKAEIFLLLCAIFTFNWVAASLTEKYFDQIFKINKSIQIVAHRAGGDLEAENTVEGVKEAIKENASFVEIDVQRTKDGKYVINHDATFNRTAGVDKTPMEMTFNEIKELEVENAFDLTKPNRKVASFEEILDAAKGKIGVFVELKEKSADYKMVDDVVKIIKEKNMLDECVILSLDYDLIEYTHDNYPEIKTGFLYFFSTGDLKDLKADYLIMEEGEASHSRVSEIHEANKKAIVWTVNTEESIDRFIKSNVDGIITDHVLLLNKAKEEVKKRTHLEIIIDSFRE